MAIQDLGVWRGQLLRELPSGTGAVAINAATRMVTVTVQWGERGNVVQFITSTEI